MKMCSNIEVVNNDFKAVGTLPQDDVDQRCAARAPITSDDQPKRIGNKMPPLKKRRTRRGKNKRRHPYLNLNRERKSWNVIKPEAPHNSNQFLIEDQGNTKEIDERLRNDKMMARTRDSSFSMDSDDFYSSPDDEEAFLRKDFDDTYENLRAERFTSMSKAELIEEFLILEKRLDVLSKCTMEKPTDADPTETKDVQNNAGEFEKEIERLLVENENLKQENNDLRNKISLNKYDSEDSESDSSETCTLCSSSCSSSSSNLEESSHTNSKDPAVDYIQTNGHSPTNLQPV